MKRRFTPIFAAIALAAFAACGGSSGRGKNPDSGPVQNPDTSSADDGPTMQKPDTATPAIADTASIPRDTGTTYQSDSSAEQIATTADARADLPQALPDSQRDDAAMITHDTNLTDTPYAAPDSAIDKPPIDTRPACNTPLCQCTAVDAGIILPMPLANIAGITDYATLGLGKYLNTQIGFGIYSDDVGSDLIEPSINLTGIFQPGSEIGIVYSFRPLKFSVGTCNCYYMYYDWFSLRRQFLTAQDFCGAAGFQIDLKGDISKPRPEATLRITLADTACKNADGSPALPSDGGLGSDELWWKNIPQESLSAEWKTLQIPFSEFTLGNSRRNDYKLDPRCITAFEVNYQYDVDIWCGGGCDDREITGGGGHFEFRNAQIY